MRLGLVGLTLRGDCPHCEKLVAVCLLTDTDLWGNHGHRCTICGGPATRLRLVDKAVA